MCISRHNYIKTLLKVHVPSSMKMGSKDRLHVLSYGPKGRIWCVLSHPDNTEIIETMSHLPYPSSGQRTVKHP